MEVTGNYSWSLLPLVQARGNPRVLAGPGCVRPAAASAPRRKEMGALGPDEDRRKGTGALNMREA